MISYEGEIYHTLLFLFLLLLLVVVVVFFFLFFFFFLALLLLNMFGVIRLQMTVKYFINSCMDHELHFGYMDIFAHIYSKSININHQLWSL